MHWLLIPYHIGWTTWYCLCLHTPQATHLRSKLTVHIHICRANANHKLWLILSPENNSPKCIDSPDVPPVWSWSAQIGLIIGLFKSWKTVRFKGKEGKDCVMLRWAAPDSSSMALEGIWAVCNKQNEMYKCSLWDILHHRLDLSLGGSQDLPSPKIL